MAIRYDCVDCTPRAHPSPGATRSGEGHVGVRFGDAGHWSVTLDGLDVTDLAVEADADAGWVIAMVPAGPDSWQLCDAGNGRHPLTVLMRGVVQATRAPRG